MIEDEELHRLEDRTNGLYEIAHYPSSMWLPRKEWGEDVNTAAIRLVAEDRKKLAEWFESRTGTWSPSEIASAIREYWDEQ